MRRVVLAVSLVACLAGSATAVVLRYQFQVGQKLKYQEKMTAKGNLTLTTALGEQAIPIEATAEETRSLEVTAQADGGYWVESRSLSAKSTMTVQGQRSSQDLPGTNLKLRLTPLGDVLEIQQLATTQRGDTELDLKLDSLLAAARLIAFPEANLEPGASWSKEIPLRSGGEKVTAKAACKLLEIKTVEGRPMAVIESRYEVPIPQTDGTMKLGAMAIPVRVKGVSSGTTRSLWDIQRGRSHSTEGSGKVDVQLWLVGLTTDPAVGKFEVDLEAKLVP